MHEIIDFEEKKYSNYDLDNTYRPNKSFSTDAIKKILYA